VSNAYINEFMKREVYCRMPPGYVMMQVNGNVIFRRLRPGEKQPNQCMMVVKALYGGMECGRIFWEAWVDWHIKNGFQMIHEDRCYLHKRDGKGNWIKFSYHVDDNFIAAEGWDYYQDYLAQLSTKFDYTEGELDSHLGVAYHFDRLNGVVRIEQSAQIWKFIKEFGHENCKPAPTPTLAGPTPCAADCDEPCDEKWDMEGFVGQLPATSSCVHALTSGNALKFYPATRRYLGNDISTLPNTCSAT
jgi:hypothetical protein